MGYMAIKGYIVTFDYGNGTGAGCGTLEDDGEYFATLEDARDAFERRVKWSRGTSPVTKPEWNEDGTLNYSVPWKTETVDFPSVNEQNASMEVHEIVHPEGEGYFPSGYPLFRFVTGPRGGIRREYY